MSFASVLNTRHLPEKPWKLGAVVRLLISVIICIFLGAVVALVFRYFETPEKSSVSLFLGLAFGAIALLAGGLLLMARPWPLEENYLSKLIGLLTCIYGGILFTWLAGRLITGKIELRSPILGVVLMLFFFQGAAVVLAHFFLREHQMSWNEGFGLNNRPTVSLFIGLCVGALALYPVWMLQELSIHLLQQLTFHPHEQQVVDILRRASGWMAHVMMGVGTIFIAPIGEEILFRGILYPTVKRRYGPQLALWGTSILFGVIHFNLATFLPLTVLALILVGLYEYTGNLVAPIAVHCFFNAANFVALYTQQN